MGEPAILLLSEMCSGVMGQAATVEDLIQDVYGELRSTSPDNRSAYIIDRAVFTPVNEHVDIVNNIMNVNFRCMGCFPIQLM